MVSDRKKQPSSEHGQRHRWYLEQKLDNLNDPQTVAHFKVCVVGAQMANNEDIIGLVDRQMELLDAQSFACVNSFRYGIFEENPNYCPPERITEIKKNLEANHGELRSAQDKIVQQSLTGFSAFRTSIFGADYQFEQSSEDGEKEIEIDERISLTSEKAIRQGQNESLAALYNFITHIEDGARHSAACRATLRQMASDIRNGIMDERHTMEFGSQILAANASSGLNVEDIINNVYGLESFFDPNLKPSTVVRHFINVSASHATTAVRTSTHRTPHRARRVSAGHGASAKSGDDGDGDGDGEPPRPRSAQTPTPPLHILNSLTHSLIFVGGAQW
ncbi:hypothetical protein [Acidithiobacillus sp.]